MNKHILLVMRWLNDKESVSQEELEKSRDEAWAANVYEAYIAVAYATCIVDSGGDAARWVDKYFDRTGENRAQYKKELEKWMIIATYQDR